MKKVILAIDPGSVTSGIVVYEDGILVKGDNLSPEELFGLIDWYVVFNTEYRLSVAYEDIKPYTSRFRQATIDTCKLIGRLDYVLSVNNIPYKSIARNEVKHYVFNKYNELCVEDVDKKIAYKQFKKKDGSLRTASFLFVDDRIVKRSMKLEWNIETPKPGRSDKRGIKGHAWQALGILSKYLDLLSASLAGTGERN